MSLFKRRGSKAATAIDAADSASLPSSGGGPGLPAKGPRKARKGATYPGDAVPTRHLDDFGRTIDRPLPAFSSAATATAASQAGGGFGGGYGVGDDEPATELVLMFGYTPLATTLELRSDQVAVIVERVCVEIRERGA